jgi:hypothetical protein
MRNFEIDDLINNEPLPWVIAFKEQCLFDDYEEYLKR